MELKDIDALAEAVLESRDPKWSELIKAIRNEDCVGLRDGARAAHAAVQRLAERGFPGAAEFLQRAPGPL